MQEKRGEEGNKAILHNDIQQYQRNLLLKD